MKAVSVHAALAIVALGAGDAAAQLDHPPEMRRGRVSDREIADHAACVVSGSQLRTAQMLEQDPRTAAANDAVGDLLKRAPGCAAKSRVLQAPTITWRGAFAEALYLKAFKASASAPDVAHATQPAWLADAAPYAVAQCAAEQAPALADALVRSDKRSSGEVAAVNSLLPALRRCGAGRKVDFDRVTIHGMVSEGLFRARGGIQRVAGK